MLRRLVRRLLRPRSTSAGAVGSPLKMPPHQRLPYAPAHPEFWSLDTAFDPDFLAALAAGADPDRLAALATEVHPDLWALRVLNPAWCEGLRAELALHAAWARASGVVFQPPNSMNRYGLVLDSTTDDDDKRVDARGPVRGPAQLLPLAPLREALGPLAARLFPELGPLDSHHGFVVHYAMDGDRALGFHADDAEVTLNLCLGGGFEGGDLWFEGRRCAQHHDHPAHPGEPFRWQHQPGVALLHAGGHRHGAHSITRGERQNLILWMRAGALRAVEDPVLGLGDVCPAWCGAQRDPN
jgi:hypothetical protein